MKITHILCLFAAVSLPGAISLAQTNAAFFAGAPVVASDSAVQVSDQKAGSLLVFPFYGSDGTSTNDTRLTITNVGPAGLPGGPGGPALGTATEILNNLNVHLFWIDATCAQADGYVCFTKFQSWTFKASEWDPVTARGFLVAVAVDPMGYPISYNGLIGNAFVNCNVTQSGVTEKWLGNYGAEAFASLGISIAAVPGPNTVYFYTTGSTPNAPATSAQLPFSDGPRNGQQGYDATPNSFAAEFQSTKDSVGQTVLTVPLLGQIGGLLGGNAIENNGIGAIYRNDEKLYSWTGPGDSCQQLIRLDDNNPRIVGKLGNQIRAGNTGTMIWTTISTRIFIIGRQGYTGGAVGLFITPQAGNNAWVGIRGLHKRAVAFSIVQMPVFMPTCVI